MTHVYKFFDPDAIESPLLQARINAAITRGELNAVVEEGSGKRWVSGAELEQFLAGQTTGFVFKYSTD